MWTRGRALCSLIAALCVLSIAKNSQGAIVDIPAAHDTRIDEQAPTQNLGSYSSMGVRSAIDGASNDWEIASLIEFDLSGIPSGATIVSATLYLYYFAYWDTDPVGRIHRVYRVTSPWGEATVTWNSRPTWSPTQTSQTAMPGSYGWVSWDVTADVAAFHAGTTNHGWIIRDIDAWVGGGIPAAHYRTRENGSVTPYLRVEWTTPEPGWAMSYGGAGTDEPWSLIATPDSGCVLAGITKSFGLSDQEAWVLRLDSEGAVRWQEILQGAGFSVGGACEIAPTDDGHYFVAAFEQSPSFHFWLWKLGQNDGQVQWVRTYGGSAQDGARALSVTPDGGCAVSGWTRSFTSGEKFLSVKVGADGTTQWQHWLGGTSLESPESIVALSDQEYVATGYTTSWGAGFPDVWVVRMGLVSGSQVILWQKAYGGIANDRAREIRPTSDGGFVVAGFTSSFGAGSSDFWVLKLDDAGSIQWQKAYGGSEGDDANTVVQTPDGGYLVAGDTQSFGVGILVLKLSPTGTIEWQRVYRGSGDNGRAAIAVGGGYYVAGEGEDDIQLYKTDESGDIADCDRVSNVTVSAANTSATVTNTLSNRNGVFVTTTEETSSATATDCLVTANCGKAVFVAALPPFGLAVLVLVMGLAGLVSLRGVRRHG